MLAQTAAFETWDVDHERVVVQMLEPKLTWQGLGAALIVPDGAGEGAAAGAQIPLGSDCGVNVTNAWVLGHLVSAAQVSK